MTDETCEHDRSEIEAEHEALKNDLRSLVRNYRSTARMFPDGSTETRVAAHCTDKLEETLAEYDHD